MKTAFMLGLLILLLAISLFLIVACGDDDDDDDDSGDSGDEEMEVFCDRIAGCGFAAPLVLWEEDDCYRYYKDLPSFMRNCANAAPSCSTLAVCLDLDD